MREIFLAFANRLGVTFDHQMQARPRREGFKIPNIDVGCRGSTHITSRNFNQREGWKTDPPKLWVVAQIAIVRLIRRLFEIEYSVQILSIMTSFLSILV